MKLSRFLERGVVLPELEATTTEAVIGEMLDGLILVEQLDAARRNETLIALLKRESIGTTGLGSGVALPHAKLGFLDDFACALGVSQEGADFGASDSRPVQLVFMLLSPDDDPYGHLNLMGVIAGVVRAEDAIARILRCRSVPACISEIAEIEKQLFPDD